MPAMECSPSARTGAESVPGMALSLIHKPCSRAWRAERAAPPRPTVANAATHHPLWSPKPAAVAGRNIAAMPVPMTRSPPAVNRTSVLSAAASRAALTTATSAATAASVQFRAGLPIAASASTAVASAVFAVRRPVPSAGCWLRMPLVRSGAKRRSAGGSSLPGEGQCRGGRTPVRVRVTRRRTAALDGKVRAAIRALRQ